MIILDTNVLSELMKPAPSPKVIGWIRAQAPDQLFTTSVTEAEIFYGIQLLSSGKRRDHLSVAAEAMFSAEMAGRVIAFGSEAARAFSQIAAGRRAQGRPIRDLDAQIAAIVHVRDATLATRNTKDFEDCGIHVVDPWTA